MSARSSRSASIPIPAASTARSLEDAISIPFTRQSAIPASPTRTRRASIITDGHRPRGPSISPVRGMSGTSPSARPLVGSYSSMLSHSPLGRGFPSMRHPSSPTHSAPPPFQPRIIRETSSASHPRDAAACVPSGPSSTLSTSPTRPRRLSATMRSVTTPAAPRISMSLSAGAPSHPPFTYSTSTPHVSTAATHGQAFPLPRYLEYSALRDLLHPDDTPAVTPAAVRSTAAASLSRVQSHAPVRPIPIPYPYLRSSLTPVDSESEGNTPSPSPPPRRGTSVPVTIAPAPSTSGLRIPTRWGEQSKSSQLTLSADGCELTFCGASLADRDTAASARTACPIPRACGIYYFEVEILERGAKGKSVSIGFSTEKLRMSRMPGWEPYSWAYYGDDGRVYSGQKEAYTFVEEFQSGDVIGCGIDFSQNRAFYTKNGTFLGMFFEGLPADDLYPAIGLRHPHESIRVNFGSVPFHYAIADHARTQRDTIWEHIMHGPAEDEAGDRESGVEGAATRATLQRLVMSYLSHHGYVSTLRNFRTQCADESVIGSLSPAVKREDGDVVMEIDDAPSASMSVSPGRQAQSRHSVDERGPDPTDPESPDFQRRVAILHAVREGNIDVALDGLRAYYPHALGAQSGLLLFRLRCRKFVELVLKASEALRRVKDVEKAQGGSGAASEAVLASDEDMYATGKGEDADGEGAMDVDDPSPEALSPSASQEESVSLFGIGTHSGSASDAAGSTSMTVRELSEAAKAALHLALSYGQELEAEYKTDARPEIRVHLRRTFGMVAYDDPEHEDGEMGAMAGQEARVELTGEVNQAILESQGRPVHSSLETLFRQTGACVVQLGVLGVGAAAYADVRQEFLET